MEWNKDLIVDGLGLPGVNAKTSVQGACKALLQAGLMVESGDGRFQVVLEDGYLVRRKKVGRVVWPKDPPEGEGYDW